ncbi:MAG: hypothetical protein ABI068_01055 [Ktedonobacterales bacterium]
MNTRGDVHRDRATPPAPHRSLLTRSPWLLGILAGVSLSTIIFITLVTLYTPAAAPPSPEPTAAAFCADLVTQHYDAAYMLLSSAQQAQGTESQFTASQRELDTLQGPVSHCAATASSASATQATVTLRITRGAKTTSGALTLVLQGSSWRVDRYDTSVI